MARNVKAQQKPLTTEWVGVQESVTVKLARGDYFSLNWFGAVIHGCAVRENRDGESFISWPSFRGTDGQFVRRAYVYAPRGSDDERILERVVQTVLLERDRLGRG